ncbi:response regulator transcription factor [Gracilibacillus ureilyticus]|uniref:response regulator transcription factor n=1 Tax=Gracilibacillus ureilyticus TaxID=531814 RepID=UPI001FDF3B2A|nr:response regulator [Gracilibacillus ureilyticus]
MMLVDDDFPMVEYLAETIDWQKLGLTLISTHENGLQALEFAKKEVPDILITDIGMPKMNGIELTEKLKQLNENIQVAIISCHNEFSYAQKALKMNVQDYLLKESLDIEDMKKILIKCKNRLDTENNQLKEIEHLQFKINQSNDIEEQRLFKQFVKGISNQLINDYLNPEKCYIPVLLLVNDFYRKEKKYISEDTLLFAIRNVTEEMIRRMGETLFYIHYEGNKSFLLYENDLSIKIDYYKVIQQLLTNIQSEINRVLDVEVSFIVGHNGHVESLKMSIDQLLFNDKLFYLNKNTISTIRQNVLIESNVSIETEDHIKKLISLIKQAVFHEDSESLKQHLIHFKHYCFKYELNPGYVKETLIHLVLELKGKVNIMYHVTPAYYKESIQNDVLLLDLMDEVIDYVERFIDNWKKHSESLSVRAKHKDVLNACYFVSRNIESKFSLEEVADHLFLNASYFSRLFKREMKMTFIEYVKKAKVERAKEILKQSHEPVGAISERLGYDNQSYFIKIFRQYTGYTPYEYRQKFLEGVI